MISPLDLNAFLMTDIPQPKQKKAKKKGSMAEGPHLS
jgi:hypothetical protein